ncbi:hypothetical protein BY996DRAFT_4610982 [Phakopsora pachyrhizi]|uniref:SUI1 domain-containing protein n=1 Tax=Phakopsora pachyrhizi TaxID=170000 RepID=A0AAV0AMS4_PHAPC|nr:hypothetical protein BY996DRAFT_4610982 [Phakopsora pachyrhizi]CAH7668791.1 hypothetical protein PPACK8108_LOCUS3345 [Phakopsora pachyrhizi]
MFKRPHSTKQSASISNSVRKRLIKDLISDYLSSSSVATPVANQLVPQNTKLARSNTHLNEQVSIYSDQDGDPIWLRLDKGNGDLIPSVYTLLRYPDLLPIVRTNRTVLEKLVGGADLMVPGLLKESSLTSLRRGTIVAVADLKKSDTSSDQQADQNNDLVEQIWAVGRLAEDGDRLVRSETGKAVITIHTRDDFLWKSGSQRIPQRLDLSDLRGQDPDENPQEVQQSSSLKAEDHDLPDQQPNRTEPPSDPLETTTPSKAISPQDVDEILLSSLLLSLWTSKTERTIPELPMPASLFYSNHVLPFRPTDSAVGVKESSSKNLLKWLKMIQKKGYLTIKEFKATETMVMNINFDHQDVEKVKRYKTLIDGERSKERTQEKHQSREEAEGGVSLASTTRLIELYKPNRSLKQSRWITLTSIDPNRLYTKHAIKEELLEYLNKTQDKFELEKRNIKVDHDLLELLDLDRADNLTKKDANNNISKNPTSGSSASNGNWDQLMTKGTKRMTNMRSTREVILNELVDKKFEAWWRLERGGEQLVEKRGKCPMVELRTKKRAGNKIVTHINGLEIFGIDPIWYSKQLKISRAISTSTHKSLTESSTQLPKAILLQSQQSSQTGSAEVHPLEVECQGDQKRFVAEDLVKRFGIPKQFIKEII